MGGPNLANPTSSEFETAVTAAVDRDRLKILEIAFYIAGGLTIFTVSFLLIHFTLFLVLGLNPHLFDHSTPGGRHDTPPPPGLFLGFAGLLGLIILLGWIFGAFQIYAGRCLRARRNYLLILVVAGVECIFIPWGTALGVFTILVLQRLSVRALFPAEG
jgi:hypothetical protein